MDQPSTLGLLGRIVEWCATHPNDLVSLSIGGEASTVVRVRVSSASRPEQVPHTGMGVDLAAFVGELDEVLPQVAQFLGICGSSES